MKRFLLLSQQDYFLQNAFMRIYASALGRKRSTPSDLEFLAGELIGEKTSVEKSSGKGFQGLEGKIVDEKRNTFVLETGKGRKTVPKKVWVFFFPDHGIKTDGEILVSLTEDRTKKIARLSVRR